MRLLAYGVLGLCAVALPRAADAKRCTDDVAVAAARAAAEAQCDCAGSRNHGQYVKCVNEVAKAFAESGDLPQECKGAVTSCAAKSTCGKPGAVTCCRVDRKGKVKCSIKKSADKCNPPNGGTACVGAAASCCDSCQASSEGGAFVCEGGTTTSSTAPPTTTSAAPTTTTSSSTAAPTTTSAAPTTTSAAPTTTTSSTAVPPTSSTSTTSSTTTTLVGSPSGAFFEQTP